MKLLKVLLYIILAVIVLFLGAGLFARKNYHIERSVEIDAPQALIHEHARYFKNFHTWSPWQHLDPNQKESIEGPDGQVGAVHKWVGNDDVGEGQQTITAITPDRIDTEVKFIKPFESTSPTFMAFKADGKKTTVSWAMDIHIAFPWNGMAMFTDVDAGVGKDYEQGLQNLKKVCEAIAHKKYRGYEVAETELPTAYYAGVRKVVPFPDIPAFFGANLPKVLETAQKGGATLAGPPSGLFWSYDEQAGKSDMAAAVSIAAAQKFGNGISVFTLPGGQALEIDYYGPYAKTGEAHLAMDEYMTEKKLRSIPPVVEWYVTDPGIEKDTSKWLTKVIYYVEPMPEQQ